MDKHSKGLSLGRKYGELVMKRIERRRGWQLRGTQGS